MRDRKRQQSLTPHLDYHPEGRNDDDESDNQQHGLRDDQSTTDRPPSDDVLGTALSELIAECPVSPIPTLRTSPPPEDTVTNVHSERSHPDTPTEVGCPRSTVAHTAAVDVPTKPSSLVKNFSVALAVTLLFFLSLVGLRGTSPPNDGLVAGSLSAASLEGSSFESPPAGFVSPSRLKPIQQVELGDRVETGLTAAQLAAAVDDPASAPWWDQLDADVDADTWRQINLVVTNDQGSRSEVDLLRPVSWLSAHQANVGGRIYLSMPEMGIEGYGEVISIGNSPEIASGPGCVVTGRFRHVSNDVLSVRLSDQSAALGVTAQHPVYSLDRGDFVAAGELSAGERLATLAGPTAVLGIKPQHTAGQHTAQTVYNLEVQGQHVFRVTSNGLLVHNDCPTRTGYGAFGWGKAPNSVAGKIVNIPGVGNLDLTKSGVARLLEINSKRIGNKIGTKIGKGELPFPISKAGTEQARKAILETLENATDVTPAFTGTRGRNTVYDIYSSVTGFTVRFRKGGVFDTLIPGATGGVRP